jgi:hypothetical protein
VPIVFWSNKAAFLRCASNLAKVSTSTRWEIVSETHDTRRVMVGAGCFTGHLSVRVGMRNLDLDETMGIGELRRYPEYHKDLAFMGHKNDLLVFYPVSAHA